MSTEKPAKKRLLSRLASPFAKAAQLVRRRTANDDQEQYGDIRALADDARRRDSFAAAADDEFTLATEQILKQEDGAFQTKLHIVSLVEFREGVGDKWSRLSEKVMMIAEGVIHMHMGTGNICTRKGTDFFILLFRTCSQEEGRRRAIIIVQELGARLMGSQFIGGERPLALTAELSLEDALLPDGSLNADAVHAAVGDMRSFIATQMEVDPDSLPAWMRPSKPGDQDAGGLRRHLQPSQLGGAKPAVPDGRAPISVSEAVEQKPTIQDPGWEKLEVARKKADPSWVVVENTQSVRPLPADMRLSLLWRPTWVGRDETIGAYVARLQRDDNDGHPPIEGACAYPQADHAAALHLDRFCVGSAIRDIRQSESTGNRSTAVIPLHWDSVAAENRMEILYPFGDLSQDSRSQRVMVEVFGLPAHVKPVILRAALAQLRSICREVMVRSSLSATQVAMIAESGATMVSLDMAQLTLPERQDDARLLQTLDGFANAARQHHLGACLWGARHRQVVVGAVQQGFAMINGPALMKDLPKPAKVLPAPRSRFLKAG